MKRVGGRFAERMTITAVLLLGGCTLDVTDVGDVPGDSIVAAPAVLTVRSRMASQPAEDGLGFLDTTVELHPGIDEEGKARIVVPGPLELHGATVQPEVWVASDGVHLLRWHYQDSVSVDVETLHFTPPAVQGLPSPPEIEMQIGIRLEPEGSIVLGPSDDLVLEVEPGGAPPGYVTDSRAHWSLRVGSMAMYATGTPASTLIVPSGWLAGTEFPATLDLSYAMEARHDPDVSPSYVVEIRTLSAVRRQVTKAPIG